MSPLFGSAFFVVYDYVFRSWNEFDTTITRGIGFKIKRIFIERLSCLNTNYPTFVWYDKMTNNKIDGRLLKLRRTTSCDNRRDWRVISKINRFTVAPKCKSSVFVPVLRFFSMSFKFMYAHFCFLLIFMFGCLLFRCCRF